MRIGILLSLIVICLASAGAQPRAYVPYAGRWDLTLEAPDGTQYPSWMEVSQRDGTVVVVVVGRSGSLHGTNHVTLAAIPVSTTPSLNESAVVMGDKTVASRLSFTSDEYFGSKGTALWQIDSAGNKLTGTQTRPDGVTAKITGERMPVLKRNPPSSWPAAQPLLGANDLTGWEPIGQAENHWKIHDGELINESAGANLRTTALFEDFKLHVEYNCPDRGNSGIYLRGRYEVQLEYEPAGTEDPAHSLGSIYGFLAPSSQLPAKPGEWEALDITLVGRQVSVVRNGVPIIDNKQIPGITGGALDSHEGAPGPIYLQGDHTGGMKFRNITISAFSKRKG